jgi:hypothetical protein
MRTLARLAFQIVGLAAVRAAVSMAIPDAGTVAAKWQRNTSAAAQDYATGVANTDKDPTALAIAGGQRYIQRVTEAFNSGKWANRLRAVGKTGWQQAVATKGVQNFSTGVNAAEGKVATVFAPLLAFETTLQQQVRSMPGITDADREARMLAWVRGMRQYQAR